MAEMTLYHTPTSPFARKVRIVLRERGLMDRIYEFHAQLRSAENEVLAVNPTGKVPALTVDEGMQKGLVLLESTTICDFLEELGDAPPLQPKSGPERWHEKGLDSYAHALLDSIAWRSREFRRPEGERSAGFVSYEAERQERCFDDLEKRVDELAAKKISISRILFAVALDFFLLRLPEYDWRPSRPRLAEWHAGMARRPSFEETKP
jgi:glutathione S-transferase